MTVRLLHPEGGPPPAVIELQTTITIEPENLFVSESLR